MSSIDRQSRIIASEDWKKIYQSFRNADFQSYDFDNLRRTMINYLRQNYPEDFNDYIESSEYLAIIDMIAFLGQNLSFRIDLNARENFLETAERRESVLRLARLISYNPSRNKPANGLLKFDAISTTENIKDSTGLNLSNIKILWNDRSNPRYFEQFVKILNSALPADANIGNPVNSQNIDGVATEQYRVNALNTDIPVFNFTKNIEGLSTRFEVVSTAIANEQIIEESPLPGNSPSFLYRDDGQGAGSSNTGFFMHFRQGTLENAVFSVSNPVPNQIIEIDDTNINDSDIWLYRLDSNGIESNIWTKLDSVEGNNIIYNSLFEKIKTVYAAITRVEDRINLVFSDGVFGELPSGNFRIYYRTSDNRNLVVLPSSLQSIQIDIPYISRSNTQESLTITLGLKYIIDNAETSQTSANIKSNAPATYYTQNRLVTAEDYNIGPLGLDQNIIKTKTVNRISSGISKYFDLTDPTGKYSTTSVFGTDGILYKQEYVEKINFKFVTQSDIEGVIYSKIESIIANINTKNFYQENFNRSNAEDLNAVWRQTTVSTNRSTGYFQQVLDFTQIFTIDNTQSIYEVGSFSLNSLKFIESGAMCKFVPPNGYYFTSDGKLKQGSINNLGAMAYMWATVQRVVEDGTTILGGLGPITFNETIPDGAILSQILPKYSRTVISDVKRQIIDRIFSYKEFGLRYDQNDRQWKLITAENINTFEAFSLQREGSSIGENQDSSWMFYFQTDGFQYTVTYRNLRYVFESSNEVKFFFDSADKIYDPKTGKILKDKITVLSVNRKSNSLESFNKDFDWTISNAYKDSEGYSDARKIQVNFFDKDDDGIADNPDVFYDIVDEINTPIDKRFVFQKKYSTYNRVEDYRYFDNSNNTIKIRKNDQTNPITPSEELEGQVFYFVDFDLFKVLNKSQNNMTVTTEYRAFIGRDNLKFHYVHVADSEYRIDPAKSNIMDTFILTKSYDDETRKYIRGIVEEKPLPPSTDELSRNYGLSINKIKSISDEIVFHPVKYKILFGEKADKNLQVTFKAVKNKDISLNSNQIKADIINLINQFFDIENWDFGDTFYFQELSSYIMSNLTPELLSIVIVPKQPDQVFGSLFEIKSESDEIFISGASVSDIEIIDEHTSSNLQTTGKVITSISGSTSGVQTRSSFGPTLLPSSTITYNPNVGNSQTATGLGNVTQDEFTVITGPSNQIDIGNVDPINPTFVLSGPSNADEGQTITINLTTTDVLDGSRVPYLITGATIDDLSGTPLSGVFTVNSNTSFINITIASELPEEGSDSLTVVLRDFNVSHTVVIRNRSI